MAGTFVTLIAVDKAAVVVKDKQCHNAQLQSCILMFAMFSANCVFAIFMDTFRACNNCMYNMFYNICSSLIPPVYVLVCLILIIVKEQSCGPFNLNYDIQKFPLRMYQSILIFLLVISPFYYENTNHTTINNNYVLMKD